MATDAQREANKRYLATKKTLTIRLDPNDYKRLHQAAADAGLSVQRFILTLVLAYIDDDGGDTDATGE